MTADFVVYISRETLITVLYIAAPLLGTTLLVGLAVGIFQAVTSIHEMTLTFIPKMAIGRNYASHFNTLVSGRTYTIYSRSFLPNSVHIIMMFNSSQDSNNSFCNEGF